MVYRNDYIARMHSALGANYPILWKIVGDEAFQTLADLYRQTWTSPTWNLNNYGEHLAHLLLEESTLNFRTNYPFLIDLAKLEWQSQDYFNEALPSNAMLHLPQSEEELSGAKLHPNLRLMTSEFQIPAIYRAAQNNEEQIPADWHEPSYYFLSKKDFIVQLEDLNQSQFELLSLWKNFRTLSETLNHLESGDPEYAHQLVKELGPLLVRLQQDHVLTY